MNGQRRPADTERLFRTAQQLPRNSLLRPLVHAVREGATQPPDRLARLSNALCSGRRERDVAVMLLGVIDLSPEERRELSGDIQRWVQQELAGGVALAFWRWLIRFLPLEIGLLLSCILWGLGTEGHGLDAFAVLGASVGAIIVGALCMLYTAPFTMPISYLLDHPRRLRTRAWIGALGHVGEPATTETLLQAWACPDLRDAARAALTLALPGLTSDLYGQMPAGFSQRLCRTLENASQELTLAVLTALQNVGDGSAVRPLEEFRRTMWADYLKPEVLQVLAETLAILREREKSEAAPKMLLRAATAPPTTGRMLLRPASASLQPDATLLRSAQNTPAQAEELLRAQTERH